MIKGFVSASRVLFLMLFILFLFSPVIYVFANQLQTTMTWFVPFNRNHTIAYGGTCSATAFFFDENHALVDDDIDGNGHQVAPRPDRLGGTLCQTGSTAGMLVTNAGNTTISIDANFAGALDVNVWLKVWEGNGAGCGGPNASQGGGNGFGGWQYRCAFAAPVNTIADVNTSGGCRDFNSSNGTIAASITTNIPVNDTNQLCFSGDFMAELIGSRANVTQGDHNGVFQTWSDSNIG